MKKVAIIGGGIAGLSAGIYAQSKGFESSIYEKHSIVGGQCTGWDRNGYHIDGCIHWLTGTKEGSDLNKLWQDVGALDNNQIIQLDSFGTYEFESIKITLWRDINRLSRELIEISKEDEISINDFINDVKTLQKLDIPVKMPLNMLPKRELFHIIKDFMKIKSVMNRNSKITCEEYANKFKHIGVRKMFSNCFPKGSSIFTFMASIASFTSGNGAIPKGGSRAMAMRMKNRYLSLGGKIITNLSAKEILIENETSVGIKFENGAIKKADYIIASCDPSFTFDKLLKGKYRDKQFQKRYDNENDYRITSSVLVSLGVDAYMKEYPSSFYFETFPFTIAGKEHNSLGVKNYSFDSCYAPKGKTLLTVCIVQYNEDYPYWEKLYTNREKYNQEKNKIGEEVKSRIENYYKEIQGKIEILDVATPVTYNRYTNAYKGAWMAFMMTPKSKDLMHSGEIKGLKNFYLTGQWLQPPGGLPVAAINGKFTIQRICKKEKIHL